MTDIRIRIERKLPIPAAPRTGNNEQQYRVFFEDEEIGTWRVPECSAARWLLEHGKAERADTLRTFHNGPAMRGSVGWFADHTVSETDKHGLRIVKWVPMPEGAKGRPRVLTGTASGAGDVE